MAQAQTSDRGPKRQHWLPCAYLQFFDISGTPNGRGSRVFWTDGTRSEVSRVENLGVKKYMYSRVNPAATEAAFSSIEGDYPPIAGKIIGGATGLSRREYFGLIMIMTDFHLRNVAYQNLTDDEHFEAYERMSRTFLAEVFADRPDQGTDLPKLGEHLHQNWRVRAIATDGDPLVTSDNPALVFSDGHKATAVWLPIHPSRGVLAFDQRRVRVLSGTAEERAVALLNGLQANLCVRHVYSDHDISAIPDDWQALQNVMAREKPERFIDDSGFRPCFVPQSGEAIERLSFMEFLDQPANG